MLISSSLKLNGADKTNYTVDAEASEAELQAKPGVYTATITEGADKETATIGIPSVAKQNLEE